MVTREQVRHVARLAKLRLGEAEEERFVAQLGQILEYVELLDEVDEKADELTHVAVQDRELRPDEPGASLSREEVLALAPDADDETFRVPAVLEGGGGA